MPYGMLVISDYKLSIVNNPKECRLMIIAALFSHSNSSPGAAPFGRKNGDIKIPLGKFRKNGNTILGKAIRKNKQLWAR